MNQIKKITADRIRAKFWALAGVWLFSVVVTAALAFTAGWFSLLSILTAAPFLVIGLVSSARAMWHAMAWSYSIGRLDEMDRQETLRQELYS